jgi:hypothetical protein
MDPLKALESLLLKMFSADELRRFLRYLPEGEALSAALPGPNASPVQVAHTAVETLDHVAYLAKPVFWKRLVEERANRRAEIDAVHAMFAQVAAPPQSTSSTPSSGATHGGVTISGNARVAVDGHLVGGDLIIGGQDTSGPALSSVRAAPLSVLTIMFASASPEKEVRLRVDKEFRQVIEKLRGARHRDRFRVVQISALRFEDLRTALLEHKPHVLHLSCHGEPDGSLTFESGTEDGAQAVPKKKVLRLLRALGSSLRIVVFNACHSAKIACELPPAIGLSVGMNKAIFDSEAVEFSVAFYEALGFGETVQTAFDTALAGLDEDDEVPELFPTPDQDPDNKRQQPLVAAT